MSDLFYNQQLKAALLGRKLLQMPVVHTHRPMFSFWGKDAGLPADDIHFDRAYRIYLTYDEALTITDVDVVVDGELLSPCSGYAPEVLDQFDYEPVLRWCLAHTDAVSSGNPTASEFLP